jgi:hypothetical protein
MQSEARYAARDRVLGVVQIKASCARVIGCRCGRRMPLATRAKGDRSAEHAHGDDRPPPHTRFGENGGLSSGGESRPAVMVGCSRPLRAQDRSYFDSFCGALAAADGQAVSPHSLTAVPEQGDVIYSPLDRSSTASVAHQE